MDTSSIDDLDRADMERLAGGHDAALNELMERHAQPIFHFLFWMLGNEDDANDLAQETFVRVFQHRSKFKPAARFTTWLYTIAGNLARNHHRWRSRHPQVSIDAQHEDSEQSLAATLPSPDASPSDTAMAGERAVAVRTAIDALPADMREVIILCEWQDLTVAEAASILNTTPKAVESRLYRSRNLLRQRLKKWA